MWYVPAPVEVVKIVTEVDTKDIKTFPQGRREPSRTAKTVIRIADLRPEVLKEITV